VEFSKMEMRSLGRTGLKVSELCLGAMTFGRETSEADSFEMLDRFVDAGGNFIDTADVYTQGISEEIVGRWMKGKDREQIVLATKVRFGTDDPANRRPNRFGLSRKQIMAAVDASLRRLGLDYIDLYQVHQWDSQAPLEETLSTLDFLVRDGKIRHAGASNYAGYQLQRSIDLCRENGWQRYVSLQPLYNLLDRTIEWELVPVCLDEGLGIMPWSPLRGGWLSGKYHRGLSAPPTDTRVTIADQKGWSESWARYANERTWGIVDQLQAVAKDVGKTVAQVALRWVLQRPGVTSPIIGARSMAQLEDNLGASGWSLSEEHMARLTDISDQVPAPYPYEQLKRA
jgi:aryl-alcohol dehydrogenase-like predicted oxidoreductase